MRPNICDLVSFSMKNTTIPLLSVSILLIAGCSNSFTRVRAAIDQAPDWYDGRRKEIRGEGYPKLAEVQEIPADQLPGKTLPAAAARVDILQAYFDANERAEPPVDVAGQMAVLLKRVEAEFAGLPADPDFLTQEEIAQIEAAFNVPRVTEGLKVRRK
ncbi:hypothetical protein [Hyphomonas adhaerens]|nr:hypothetical protein [Hyphomonas adhaerens]